MESIIKLWPFRYLRGEAKVGESRVENMGTSDLAKTLHIWESKLMTLQSLLIWENPKCSTAAFFIYSTFFWLLTFISISILTKLCVISLFLFITHEWVTLIWPEISITPEAEEDWTTLHPNIMSINELSIYLQNTYNTIITLYEQVAGYRKQNPGKFCVICVVLFCGLFTIGNMVPGCVLLYLASALIAVLPGLLLHVTPPALFTSIYKLICSSSKLLIKDLNTSGQSDLEEFIPQANLSVIRDSLDINVATNELDASDLLGEANSAPRFSSSSSDDDDSFAPAAEFQIRQFGPSHVERMTDETKPLSDAQQFEDHLVAGLVDRVDDHSTEDIEELSTGKVTWFNKALYTQLLDNFFKRPNDDSNSGDSS